MRESSPAVLAVVVAHDGAEWLPTVLAALDEQDYDNLTVLGVDNASEDGSRDILLDHFGTDRTLLAERDLGFAAAVNMAADTQVASGSELLWLLHDDAAPAPDALSRLVDALDADQALAAVGPKLVRWDDPRVLESVGMTVDVTGRADSGLEADERDQGQRDVVHDTLYVPTSGMLVRRDDYEAVGRLDRRYHVFRDDLDFCWRLWASDRRVEVVPSSVVRHAAGAANYLRLGQTAFLGPRYFAERNTLATLLKLYSRSRLVTILPIFLLVGIAKVVGFVATRRLGDAWQTLRAWAWNLLHLPETRRLRRHVQQSRARSDAEMRPLFGKVAPRLRAYGEAVTFWLTTGDQQDAAPVVDEQFETDSLLRRGIRFLRANAVLLGAGLLVVAGTLVALPVLGGGDLRGGELLPWPGGGSSPFFEDYGSSFHDVDGLGTASAPSPARFLLGALTWLSFGSDWLASRLLLLGALPVAWVTSLLALRRLSDRRIPQVVAATLFVLSPPAVAAVRTGRVSSLVVVALLPALLAAMTAMVRRDVRLPTAWRAAAAGTVLGATMIAFAPPVAALLVPGTVVLLLALPWVVDDVDHRRGARLRLLAFIAGTLLLLFPWSLDLLRAGSPVWNAAVPTDASPQPFWRLVLLVPDLDGFPGLLAGGGYLAAGVLGVALGLRRRSGTVVTLWAAALGGALAAWLLGRAAEGAAAWPGLPLIIVAAAFAALFAVAFSEAGESLGQYAIGWRHALAAIAVLAAGVGAVVMVGHVRADPWANFAVGEDALPAFIASEQEAVGPFRVLVLADEDDNGEVRWDLTGPGGPTMLRYGQPVPPTLASRVDADLADVMGGSDPGAAARLGLANVRWIVVPPRGVSDALDVALSQQLDLEPQPVRNGRVYRVTGWLPRAALVSREAVEGVVNQRALPTGASVVPLDLEDDRVVAPSAEGRTLLVAEADEGGWRASVGEVDVPVQAVDGLVRVDADAASGGELVLRHSQPRRTALVAIQLVVLLLSISLVLRPPGFAEDRRQVAP